MLIFKILNYNIKLNIWIDVASKNELLNAIEVWIDSKNIELTEFLRIIRICQGIEDISLFERRYPGYVKQKYYEDLAQKGAAALIIVADELGEKSWSQVEPQMTRGVYGIEGYRDKIPTPARMPAFWLHSDQLEFLKTTKETGILTLL